MYDNLCMRGWANRSALNLRMRGAVQVNGTRDVDIGDFLVLCESAAGVSRAILKNVALVFNTS